MGLKPGGLGLSDLREAFLGDGEMAGRMRAFDWTGSLGPIEAWPQSLKTITGFMIRSPVAMVLLWGVDGIMLYNDAYSVFAGRRHPQLLGSKVREGWPEVADFNDNVMKVGLGGGTLSYKDRELVLDRRGKPEPAWMNLDYSPVIDESGKPGGVMAIVVDVTERVLAQRHRDFEQSQFRSFAQAMPNHVWAASPDGMLNWFNQRVYEYSGAAAGTLDGMGWTAMVHPDDLEFAGARWNASLVSGAIYETEFRLRRADGVYRWHIARAVPIRGDDGAVASWVGTNTDIEEQKAALAALGELKDELEQRVAERTAALQNIRTFYTYSSEYHAMLFQRDDGAFEYEEINPATLALYGMTRDQVIGRTIDELFEPSAAALLSDHLQKALHAGEPLRYLRVQNGAAIEATATPIPADGGRRRLTVTARDVSERLGLEEQLRQAQKMEAVGQLTGGIAHDFNNLLQGITGALDRVQYRLSEGRTNDVDRFLKAAIESANRAAALTHRLLAFSRRQTLDPRALDANKLIGGMEDLLRRTMGPNVAMEVVGAGGLWPVRVDPSQLESALLNLCINARDAMPDGGKLTIETANKWLDTRAARERELPPGQYVSLCVTDTGTGMSEEVMARAFDPFFTTKPLVAGHGAGLVHDLWLCAPVGRAGADLFGSRPGHHHVPVFPPPPGRCRGGRCGPARRRGTRLRRNRAGGG